jgi:hypothetical protein
VRGVCVCVVCCVVCVVGVLCGVRGVSCEMCVVRVCVCVCVYHDAKGGETAQQPAIRHRCVLVHVRGQLVEHHELWNQRPCGGNGWRARARERERKSRRWAKARERERERERKREKE